MSQQKPLGHDTPLTDSQTDRNDPATGRLPFACTPGQLEEAMAWLESTCPGTLASFRALMSEAMQRGEKHFREIPYDEIGACIFAFSQLSFVTSAAKPDQAMNELILAMLDHLWVGLSH
ncbi:hypothetical protein [Paludibacterium sp. B53371]|uniref:hypothetical protein n=1 Tax=Paludibacterium sp. B53371 TaxID=2806263 RepID=UPI001C052D60|nr:hypothetical protein [Paludibacterium sp. B53371]